MDHSTAVITQIELKNWTQTLPTSPSRLLGDITNFITLEHLKKWAP
jgi:hypothetical protein